MSTENKIMYDSPEAAKEVTLTGWVSGGRFFGNDEHLARWSGCTHNICECGKEKEKSFTICSECRHTAAVKRYNSLPVKEYDGSPVWDWDGNKFFYNQEDIEEYMEENEMTEIELLFSEPIYYNTIDTEDVCNEPHEDWEPEEELLKAIDLLNETIRKFPAHSYTTGKERTSFKLQPKNKKPCLQIKELKKGIEQSQNLWVLKEPAKKGMKSTLPIFQIVLQCLHIITYLITLS